MLKNKKILIVLSISILLTVLITVVIVLNGKDENETNNNVVSVEQLENNFTNMFSNLKYSENEEAIVSLVYEWQKNEQGKYSINVNFPKFNLETETAKSINEEILSIFGQKLIDIANNNTAYTIYNVDYVTFTNNNIVSLIIKCTLKDGNNPQRVIIKTYNYDLENDKLITLEEFIDLKQLNKNELQSKIINEVREKSENSKELAEQGYNIYVRDIRSEEYLIKNINTYYLGQDGHLYIVFAYGNTNFTETMDVIII